MNNIQTNGNLSTSEDMNLMELAKFFWAKRKALIITAIISFICSIIIALSLPKEYSVSVKIAPEGSESTSLSSAMGGLASIAGLATPGASSGITEILYPEIIKSSPFLNEFTSIEVIYDGEKKPLVNYLSDDQKRAWWSYLSPFNLIKALSPKPDEEKHEREEDPFRPSMRTVKFENDLYSSIDMTYKDGENIFEITVTMQDPYIAAVVADSVVVKLQKYMINYKTTKTRNSIANTTLQLQKAEKAYHEAEERFAEGTDINRRLVTEKAKSRLLRLENEKNLAYNIYEQLALELETQKVELDEKTPIVTVIQPARVPHQKSAPKTMVIVVGLTFLGVVIRMMWMFAKHNFTKN
ncbi:MAG: GNVR domain-containing protein [Rikenellaceae bacterium]